MIPYCLLWLVAWWGNLVPYSHEHLADRACLSRCGCADNTGRSGGVEHGVDAQTSRPKCRYPRHAQSSLKRRKFTFVLFCRLTAYFMQE